MDKVLQFRQRAVECRDLAAKSRPELRSHYEELARTWEKLAQERETFFIEPPVKKDALSKR
jgi:hypothetical protein